MATFPSLEPLRREWEFADYATITFESKAWGSSVFEFGAAPLEQPLSLIFSLLDESEMQLIRMHYQAQRQVYPFLLPPEVWAGYSTEEARALFPVDGDWIYAGPIQEEPRSPGLYDCTVKLLSVPS